MIVAADYIISSNLFSFLKIQLLLVDADVSQEYTGEIRINSTRYNVALAQATRHKSQAQKLVRVTKGTVPA